MGAFAINQLDALRLQAGLAQLESKDPQRATRLRRRVHETVTRLSPEFPGDPRTGLLEDSDSPEAEKRWDDFANDEVCPVLDPETGTCDLYEYRPLICRTFGPPVMSEGDFEICELCYEGATDEEIAAAEMRPDPENVEATLLKEVREKTGVAGQTIVAFAVNTAGSSCLG